MSCSLGDDYATVDVEVFVGVDGIIASGTGIDVTAVDIEIACRVDGVVVAVALHRAGLDVDVALALDSLCAITRTFKAHLNLSAINGQIAISLDSFRRYAALRVFLAFASGDDTDHAIVDVDLIIAVDALAASTSRHDIQFTAVDSHYTVGLQSRTSTVVAVIAIPLVTATGQNCSASTINADLAISRDTFISSASHVDIDHTTCHDDCIITAYAIT